MITNKNLIIILAASTILITAFVYYMSQLNQASVNDPAREFQELSRQSSSDQTEEIESDLEDTDFEDLDKEFLDIEAELNSTGEAKTQ